MSAAFLSCAVRKARKEHACYWCRERIAVGDEFREQVVAEDGRIDTWRAHSECRAAENLAFIYRRPFTLSDEPACCEIDYDGGRHARGLNCPECSDMPVRS